MTGHQAEQHFDTDISSRQQLNELQRLEQTHGRKVHQWLDEGMPREAMGTPAEMAAFRMEKGTLVSVNGEPTTEQSDKQSAAATVDASRPGETRVPKPEQTTQHVPHGDNTGSQRYQETAAPVQRLPDFGNPRIPTGTLYSGDDERTVDIRDKRLKGWDPISKTHIQSAVKQAGPVCSIATLQAALASEGRETSSLAKFVSDGTEYWMKDSQGNDFELVQDGRVSVRKLIQNATRIFSQETATFLKQSLPDIAETKPGRDRDFDVKSVLMTLGEMHEDVVLHTRNKKPISAEERKQSDEDFRVGQNLLQTLLANSQSEVSSDKQERLTSRFDIDNLKSTFIEKIKKVGTPATVSFTGRYEPSFPKESPIRETRPGHVILVHGIVVRNGEVVVVFRDGNRENGETEQLPLNEFLAPLNANIIEDLRNTNEYCKNAFKNRMKKDFAADAFEIENFNIDPKVRDGLSQPIPGRQLSANQQGRPRTTHRSLPRSTGQQSVPISGSQPRAQSGRSQSQEDRLKQAAERRKKIAENTRKK